MTHVKLGLVAPLLVLAASNRDTKSVYKFESFKVSASRAEIRIDYIRPLMTDLHSPLRLFKKKYFLMFSRFLFKIKFMNDFAAF